LTTGKIQLTDKAKTAKILNRNNYILVIAALLCLIIDIDLFSTNPKYLITNGYFYKGLAIVFQITFIWSLYKWDKKKKNIIEILNNGMIINGTLIMSERIRANSNSTQFAHIFEYTVSGKKHEAFMKNRSSSVKSNYIIYQVDNPKNGVVYDELKTELKDLITSSIK